MKSSTAAMQAGHPHASVIGFALALAAGYVDTVGFVALFGLFTAHVTGNLVLIGAELANPSHGVLIKLLAFPAFLFAIAAARVIMIVALRSGLDAGPILLSVQTLLLLAFMLAGLLALPFDDSRSLLALTTGVLGSAAMGVQSAATKIVWGSPTPTTAMTGNVTQLVIDLVDVAWQGGGRPYLRKRVHEILGTVLAFGVGAVLGAAAFTHFSMLALLLPIGLIAVLVPLSSRWVARRLSGAVAGAVHCRPPSAR